MSLFALISYWLYGAPATLPTWLGVRSYIGGCLSEAECFFEQCLERIALGTAITIAITFLLWPLFYLLFA